MCVAHWHKANSLAWALPAPRVHQARGLAARDVWQGTLRAVPARRAALFTPSMALSASKKKSELILKEVKTIGGVDVNIKLENLGGSRRRISGGLAIEAPPRAIWDVLTNYNCLNEYIPNIAASGAVLQPNGRVRIEQVIFHTCSKCLFCSLSLPCARALSLMVCVHAHTVNQ